MSLAVWGGNLSVAAPGIRIYNLASPRQTLWEETFLTGEDHMAYTIASLEHHHFKYEMFRKPGDVHCHFFGTATLSRNAGVVTQPGDVFEISAAEFGRPLRNALAQGTNPPGLVRVKIL